MLNNIIQRKVLMKITELAKLTGLSRQTLYNYSKKLGYMPELSDIAKLKTDNRGRKHKREYHIYYCFLTSSGEVESDEFGEIYRREEVVAWNKVQAVELFKKLNWGKVIPEIVEVV